jgi:hypothetical protein
MQETSKLEQNPPLQQTSVSGSVFYEVHFTDCFPRTFEVKDGENINDYIKSHIKIQNRGVPKSERIYLEKVVRL